jgi:hypothetical protein
MERFTLFVLVPGLHGLGDVGKKKAVSSGRALEVKQGAEAVEQPDEAQGMAGQEELEPVQCIHEHTNVEFRRRFRKVCNGLMKKAETGSTAHTRLLLEIGKFGDPKAKQHGGKSLSEMLLDELKRRQDEREAAAAQEPETAETDGSEDTTSGGSVESE